MNKKGKLKNQSYISGSVTARASRGSIRRSGFALRCCWLLAGLLFCGSQAWADIKQGDILVVDQYGGGTKSRGALILIDPKTGQRRELSDFGNPDQGRQPQDATSVAVDSEGWIYVTDLFGGDSTSDDDFNGTVLEINPDTGYRTLVSNFGEGSIKGVFYYGLDVDRRSRLLANNLRSIVRIDPDFDSRTLVTDLANPKQGDTEIGAEPNRVITDLVLERSGKIIIGTANSCFEVNDSAIFRVHSVTGKRKLLSDFSNSSQGAEGADLCQATGLAVEASGHILAATNYDSYLMRINPRSGKRTVLSDFGNPEQGLVGGNIHGVAIEKHGSILVMGDASGTQLMSVFRVNPKTGQRTLLSDSDDSMQGPSIYGGTYMAIAPEMHHRWRHH